MKEMADIIVFNNCSVAPVFIAAVAILSRCLVLVCDSQGTQNKVIQ